MGEAQTVGEVMLLAEIRGEDDDGTYTYIRFRCSDEREWIQRGMMHAALEQECQALEAGEDED